MTVLLITYWIATTIYGVYWLIKHPSSRHGDDPEYFTVLELLGKVFPAMLIGWVAVPLFLLHQMKFRRKPSPFETTGEQAARHLFITILVITFLLSAVLTFLIIKLK